MRGRFDAQLEGRWFSMNNILGYVLAVVFGIIIFIVPSIVAYLIALFLVIWGILGIVQSLRKK